MLRTDADIRKGFLLLLLLGMFAFVIWMFSPYIVTIAIAGAAAVIFYPVHTWISRHVKGRTTLSAMIVVLLTYLVLLLPLAFIGIQIAEQAANLYAQIARGQSWAWGDVTSMIETQLTRFLPGITINLDQYLGEGFRWIASNASTLLGGTIRTLALIFLGTITYFYMLRDGHLFVKGIIELSPLPDREDKQVLDRLHRAINSVIRGSLVIAVLQGIATGIGLALFGVPNAVLFGSLAAVGALIPNVGTSLVLVPSILYLALTSSLWMAGGLLIWAMTGVGLIDNFLHPILVGKGMRMHPLFILFAVLGGLTLFGPAGFVLGPLTVSLLFALLDVYRDVLAPKHI